MIVSGQLLERVSEESGGKMSKLAEINLSNVGRATGLKHLVKDDISIPRMPQDKFTAKMVSKAKDKHETLLNNINKAWEHVSPIMEIYATAKEELAAISKTYQSAAHKMWNFGSAINKAIAGLSRKAVSHHLQSLGVTNATKNRAIDIASYYADKNDLPETVNEALANIAKQKQIVKAEKIGLTYEQVIFAKNVKNIGNAISKLNMTKINQDEKNEGFENLIKILNNLKK